MLSPADFRDVVSGRRADALAVALRRFLRLAETPYRLAVDWRNRRYDRGQTAVQHVDVPVVSVGNLTLGGTGKTPLVKWIARWFAARNVCVAIVSRGYGAAANGLNDEALELRMSLPDVPHVQNADRVTAAREAILSHGCQLILLDDGFQHRRLGRVLDVVLVDALEPFGFEHVFPRGTLREPLGGLRRANVVCLSRADAVTRDQRATIRDRVSQLAPQAVWCEVAHVPIGLVGADGQSQPLELLRGRRVAAFCGIGNPGGFRHTLAATDCTIVAWREFRDHHAYASADIMALSEMAESARAEVIVCTQKDLVKLGDGKIADKPIWAVTIEIEFLSGQELMEEALRNVTPHHPQLAPGQ